MTQVRIRHVSKIYSTAKKSPTTVTAVDDVSIDIESAQIHAVIGYSGAGKSTLLRLVNGLERASAGEITIGNSRNLATMSERELRQVRQRIGMVFQQFNLFHSRTVAKNIEYPLIVAGVPSTQRKKRVAELLEYVGLADRAHAHADQLSGGQKQRVGIARALATNPDIILADEATSALDPETSRDILDVFRQINQDLGMTILFITHEMDVVRALAQQVSVMERGKVVEQGDVFDVFSDPKAECTRQFVGTAIHTVPEGKELAALRAQYSGTLITLTLRDNEVNQQAIFRLIAEKGVDMSVVHGGFTNLGGRNFGRLTLELTGNDLQLEHTIAALRQVCDLAVAG